MIKPADPATLREAIRARPLRPYETFETTLQIASERFKASIDAGLRVGPERRRPAYRLPVAWDEPNRSKRYRQHAWDPLKSLFLAHSLFHDDAYLQAILEYTRDWHARFQAPVAGRTVAEVLAAARQPNGEEAFAWYDMAVGQRAYRLAYIIDVLARDERVEDAELAALVDSLRFHVEMLAVPSFFRGHNNHGLYQALGHVAAARRFEWLPGFSEQLALGRERLAALIRAQYFEDGAHSEHSPGYHYMILGSLLGARASGILDEASTDVLGRAEACLGWMITPGGGLPTIGDTDPRLIHTPADQTGNYADAGVIYLLTDGEIGSPPLTGVKAYPQAGYAFARLYPEGGDPSEASYLAQMCGFHSRTHKHADHCGFVWHEGRAPVLTDPGRFGYLGKTKPGDELSEQGFWYSDPRRRYVESTRAHNCLELDGQDYPRFRVKPFGSALRQADEQDGLVVFDSELRHPVGARHRRTLVFAPAEFLLVVDWLSDPNAPHILRQWFQFDRRWDVEVGSAGYTAATEGRSLAVVDLLGGASFSPVFKGQEEPMQGWVSDKAESVVPAPSVHLRREMDGSAAFATLFSLVPETVRDERSRLTASGRAGGLAWRTAAGSVRLSLARQEDDTVRVVRER